MVRKEKPDVAFFMEVDDAWLEHLLALTNEFPYVVAHPRSDNFGVALFARAKPAQMDIIWPGGEVPSVIATIPMGATNVTFIGTHPVPPGSHEAWSFRNLQLDEVAALAARSPGPVVVAGDLNMSPWSPFFRKFAEASRLKDSQPGFGFQPTWPTIQPILYIPLDHVLVSRDIAVVDRRTGTRVGSDHLPVIVDLAPGS
jgi:endonuclease/exonuclease/phosphatase (EEP) superfamily protein YafD